MGPKQNQMYKALSIHIFRTLTISMAFDVQSSDDKERFAEIA
jgi:hypothetical protein